ncbi:unnamed protein product [Prunus armeniaca]
MISFGPWIQTVMAQNQLRDGGLDLQEVLTFYYIIKTRYITWFDGGAANYYYYHHQYPTYDLCAACYGNANYIHQHSYFLDNHVLLCSKRGPPHAPPNLAMMEPSFNNDDNILSQMGTLHIYNLKEQYAEESFSKIELPLLQIKTRSDQAVAA